MQRRVLAAMSCVVVLLFVVSISAPVIAGVPLPWPKYWRPSYYNGVQIASLVQSSSLAGHVDVYTNPYAVPSTGYAYVDTSAVTAFAGISQVDAKAGFRGITYTEATGGTRTIAYHWLVNYVVDAETTFGVGSSRADYSCYVYGNLYDKTADAWKLNGDQGTKIYGSSVTMGICFYQDTYKYGEVKFTVTLIAGHTYEFYTYVMTHGYVLCCRQPRGS